MFDYTRLSNRITEFFSCDVNFAIKMGFSERTLSLKLNNKSEWKQTDIIKACELLDIKISELDIYFFTLKVQNIEQK